MSDAIKVAIVYQTGGGHTRVLAERVLAGRDEGVWSFDRAD